MSVSFLSKKCSYTDDAQKCMQTYINRIRFRKIRLFSWSTNMVRSFPWKDQSMKLALERIVQGNIYSVM